MAKDPCFVTHHTSQSLAASILAHASTEFSSGLFFLPIREPTDRFSPCLRRRQRRPAWPARCSASSRRRSRGSGRRLRRAVASTASSDRASSRSWAAAVSARGVVRRRRRRRRKSGGAGVPCPTPRSTCCSTGSRPTDQLAGRAVRSCVRIPMCTVQGHVSTCTHTCI
jgi:hypothetical protein